MQNVDNVYSCCTYGRRLFVLPDSLTNKHVKVTLCLDDHNTFSLPLSHGGGRKQFVCIHQSVVTMDSHLDWLANRLTDCKINLTDWQTDHWLNEWLSNWQLLQDCDWPADWLTTLVTEQLTDLLGNGHVAALGVNENGASVRKQKSSNCWNCKTR